MCIRDSTITSAKQGRDLLARYQQMDEYFADVVAGLREGLSKGLVAPKINVERVIRQIREMAAQPVAESPFIAPVFKNLEGAAMPKGLGEPWKAQMVAAVEQSVYGGLRAYGDFLEKELLPRARETVGVGALPLGAVCYACLLYTSDAADE